MTSARQSYFSKYRLPRVPRKINLIYKKSLVKEKTNIFLYIASKINFQVIRQIRVPFEKCT